MISYLNEKIRKNKRNPAKKSLQKNKKSSTSHLLRTTIYYLNQNSVLCRFNFIKLYLIYGVGLA